jgi:hypothetical protein
LTPTPDISTIARIVELKFQVMNNAGGTLTYTEFASG